MVSIRYQEGGTGWRHSSATRKRTTQILNITKFATLANANVSPQVNRAATWPRDYKTFPAHLGPTKEDKKAMLSNKACKDAAEIMMEFVGSMLNGM
jgi:hypothetical protein